MDWRVLSEVLSLVNVAFFLNVDVKCLWSAFVLSWVFFSDNSCISKTLIGQLFTDILETYRQVFKIFKLYHNNNYYLLLLLWNNLIKKTILSKVSEIKSGLINFSKTSIFYNILSFLHKWFIFSSTKVP